MSNCSFNVWWKLKLWVAQITFDLPKQAATPKFGIQVVSTTEPKPVTVCETEPSCKVKMKWYFYTQYYFNCLVLLIVKCVVFVLTSGWQLAATVNVVFWPVRTRCWVVPRSLQRPEPVHWSKMKATSLLWCGHEVQTHTLLSPAAKRNRAGWLHALKSKATQNLNKISRYL